MSKEKFLLLSLKEEKAKKIANAISNPSCRQILDYMAEKDDVTETQIAKELNLPISTVHYNLQNLIKAGIIKAEEYHYSQKGREVNHYKLANRYIIIAPKTTYGIKEKLKTILPVVLLTALGAGFIQIFSKYFVRGGFTKQLTTVKETVVREAIVGAEKAVDKSVTIAGEVATAATGEAVPLAAPEILENVTNITSTTTTTSIPPSPLANITLWFVIGAVFAIALYMIISRIRKQE